MIFILYSSDNRCSRHRYIYRLDFRTAFNVVVDVTAFWQPRKMIGQTNYGCYMRVELTFGGVHSSVAIASRGVGLDNACCVLVRAVRQCSIR